MFVGRLNREEVMNRIRRTPAVLAALLWSLASGGFGALEAVEFGATHVVFEKGTKLKKVETSLFMPVLDQSVRGDELGDQRTLRCTVSAMAKGGLLPAKGAVILGLQGPTASATPWRSAVLRETLDERGDVMFDPDSILGLVDEAIAAGAAPDLFEIRFDGGKGPKVSQVTVDCLHELVE
jgi:hypothetical protein